MVYTALLIEYKAPFAGMQGSFDQINGSSDEIQSSFNGIEALCLECRAHIYVHIYI